MANANPRPNTARRPVATAAPATPRHFVAKPGGEVRLIKQAIGLLIINKERPSAQLLVAKAIELGVEPCWLERLGLEVEIRKAS